MKHLVLGLSLLFLAACSTLPVIQNPISANQLAVAESAYGVALSAAVAYRNLPLCLTGAPTSLTNYCARRSVVVKLQAADAHVESLLKVARATVGQSLDATSAITALNQAIAEFKAIEASSGVN